MRILLFILTATFFIAMSPLFSQRSMLDVTFGNGGKVVTPINDTSAANDVAIQPDGKIIVGGSTTVAGRNYFALVRYNIDGSLDNTFGTAGKVVTRLKDRSSISSIAIQDDGKIVAGGSAYNFSTNVFSDSGYTIVRYNMNGIIDSLFGKNGITVVKMSNGTGDLKKLLIKPDGKILTAGTIGKATFENIPVLVQFNSNGSIDSSFGVNGKFEGYVNDVERITDMALAKDGKIFVSGQLRNAGYIGDFALLRFLENGRLDNSFGANGVVKTDFYNTIDDANAISVQADGAIVLAGYSGGGRFELARYLPNGSLDGSFGIGGKVFTPIDTMPAVATDLIVEPGGKLIVSGYTYYRTENFVVTRYHPNGKLDSTFGNNGIDTTDFAGFRDQAFASALQADGKIVLAGLAGSSNSKYSIALARYSLTVLPLKLLTLIAQRDGKTNLLEWTTVQEINIDRFEIERSPNGKDYSSIGKMNAGLSKYNFTDEKPFTGINYYRIKMIDKDGKFEYSPVRRVINSGSFYVSVYPLPAKGRLNMQIENSKAEKANILVTDISGKTLITNSVTLAAGVNNTFINVQSLSKGAYFLKIVTSEGTETRKILVE
jgi:uncharacterized delta-60 repeat protein